MKKKLMIAAGAVFALIGVLLASVLGFVLLTWEKSYEDVPYPTLTASTDPAVIAHGEYLVKGPAHCSNCHVGHLDDVMRADAGEDLPMQGGAAFEMGPLGSLWTRNLTSDKETGLGRFSDAELFRMMRHNVRPNHKASLGPMMPFQKMADDDLIAVVSYLRTLDPVKNEIPEPQWGMLAKVLFAFGPPAPFAPVVGHEWPAKAPAKGRSVERGEYLANNVANCVACHTPMDPMTMEATGPIFSGTDIAEPSPFAEGKAFRGPNLTSHETGILKNYKSPKAWVVRFRSGRAIPGSFMHWGPFSRMTEDDLVSIYMYLQTVPPADHEVGPIVETL